jgi:hypothetical protein
MSVWLVHCGFVLMVFIGLIKASEFILNKTRVTTGAGFSHLVDIIVDQFYVSLLCNMGQHAGILMKLLISI